MLPPVTPAPRQARPSLALLVLMTASCGGGDATVADAGPRVDGAVLDAAAGVADAALANPAVLWLSPINGSESNLKLGDKEPPPF